jgi:pyridoxal phosphate enzyme (YggS family)
MSNISEIKQNCKSVTIVAATKYVGSDKMIELLEEGINNFGENRVDAFLTKYEELRGYDITWHFIGSLQTNKVKKIIDKISYLHSLNSIKLASYINKYRTTPLNCFLEINLTDSITKTGINPKEILAVLNQINSMENVNVIGLMTMTEPLMTDEEKKEVFNRLNKIKLDLNNLGYTKITELSMGMSDDYLLAIESNATFVRLGRILFK